MDSIIDTRPTKLMSRRIFRESTEWSARLLVVVGRPRASGRAFPKRRFHPSCFSPLPQPLTPPPTARLFDSSRRAILPRSSPPPQGIHRLLPTGHEHRVSQHHGRCGRFARRRQCKLYLAEVTPPSRASLVAGVVVAPSPVVTAPPRGVSPLALEDGRSPWPATNMFVLCLGFSGSNRRNK